MLCPHWARLVWRELTRLNSYRPLFCLRYLPSCQIIYWIPSFLRLVPDPHGSASSHLWIQFHLKSAIESFGALYRLTSQVRLLVEGECTGRVSSWKSWNCQILHTSWESKKRMRQYLLHFRDLESTIQSICYPSAKMQKLLKQWWTRRRPYQVSSQPTCWLNWNRK